MTLAETPPCEICGEDAVATQTDGGVTIPVCAIHLSMSDPAAPAIYIEIARRQAAKKN
jgi:hypothetical protein